MAQNNKAFKSDSPLGFLVKGLVSCLRCYGSSLALALLIPKSGVMAHMQIIGCYRVLDKKVMMMDEKLCLNI